MGKVLINITQFVLAILLIPILYTSIEGFFHHFLNYPDIYQEFFFWGMMSLVLMHFFIFKPQALYEFGQNLVGAAFKFISPLDRFFSFILPFYTIIIFLLLYLVTFLFKTGKFDHYFMFFGGYAFAMQLVFVAEELQEEGGSTLRPAYLFIMSLVFILNIFLLVLLFDLVLKKFTFPAFFQAMSKDALDIYKAIFHKIYSVYQTVRK